MWYLLNLIQFILILIWFLVPGFVVVYILPTQLMYKFIRGAWSKWALYLAGIRLRVDGHVQDDGHRSFMFLANHQSFADIIVLNVALARPLHYIAKKELARIPVLGRLMAKTDCVLVSRGYNKESRRTYLEAITHIKKGLDIVVFPEGTRSRNGQLGKLRKGSFQMAVDAQIDIVPVALKNTGRFWPRNNFSFRPGIVDVRIGTPISTKGYSRESISELMDIYQLQLTELLK
jgi:1-acyl-sn-glycerol-3-phosphate acyltransferase